MAVEWFYLLLKPLLLALIDHEVLSGLTTQVINIIMLQGGHKKFLSIISLVNAQIQHHVLCHPHPWCSKHPCGRTFSTTDWEVLEGTPLSQYTPDDHPRGGGGWTPKIDRATRPFLGLSDMRQGCFLNSTVRQGCFFNSTGGHYLFL